MLFSITEIGPYLIFVIRFTSREAEVSSLGGKSVTNKSEVVNSREQTLNATTNPTVIKRNLIYNNFVPDIHLVLHRDKLKTKHYNILMARKPYGT